MAFDFPPNPTPGQVYEANSIIYTYNGYAWMHSQVVVSEAVFVRKDGDVMTGFLTLNANPTQSLHATPKQYVDAHSVPVGGLQGQALVTDGGAPIWGATIDAGSY